jgi:hypothetical protein
MKKLSLFLMTAFVAGHGFCVSDEDFAHYKTKHVALREAYIKEAWNKLNSDIYPVLCAEQTKKEVSHPVFLNFLDNEDLISSCNNIKEIIQNKISEEDEAHNSTINYIESKNEIELNSLEDSEELLFGNYLKDVSSKIDEQKYTKANEAVSDRRNLNRTILDNLKEKNRTLRQQKDVSLKRLEVFLNSYISNREKAREKAREKSEQMTIAFERERKREREREREKLKKEREKLERPSKLRWELLNTVGIDINKRASKALLLIKQGARLTKEDFKRSVNDRYLMYCGTVAKMLIEPCLEEKNGSNLIEQDHLLIDQLIKIGLDIEKIDSHGNSLFHLACDANNLNLAKFLLEKYALDINARNDQGKTALTIAQSHQQEDHTFGTDDWESGWLRRDITGHARITAWLKEQGATE